MRAAGMFAASGCSKSAVLLRIEESGSFDPLELELRLELELEQALKAVVA
jgi:hypothetical protein